MTSKTYYAQSGSFANALVISAFATRAERDVWVNAEPISGVGSHYEHGREPLTRREAEALCVRNRIREREHAAGGGDANYGSVELPVA